MIASLFAHVAWTIAYLRDPNGNPQGFEPDEGWTEISPGQYVRDEGREHRIQMQYPDAT